MDTDSEYEKWILIYFSKKETNKKGLILHLWLNLQPLEVIDYPYYAGIVFGEKKTFC